MKTGLVLEGGALRGVFTTGVCDALMDGAIRTDYIIGVSAGIANGVSYASGQRGRNLEVLTRFVRDRRYMGMRNLADRENRCYFGLEFAYETVPNQLIPFDYDAFEAFPGQIEAVVTDVDRGEAVYLPVPRQDRKNLVVQASCAMPLMSPIYRLGGHRYLDGGVSDSIPWQRALDQGCDRLVVVLTQTRNYRKQPDKLLPLIQKKYREFPNLVRAAESRAKRYNQCRDALFKKEGKGELLVIAPESTLGVSRTEHDTDKLRMLWGEGYQCTVERLEEIRDYLEL